MPAAATTGWRSTSRARPGRRLVEYVLDPDFDHPVTARLAALAPGLTAIPKGQGLDYVRDGLFDRSHMRPLPATRPGPDNDLNEKIDRIVARAIA